MNHVTAESKYDMITTVWKLTEWIVTRIQFVSAQSYAFKWITKTTNMDPHSMVQSNTTSMNPTLTMMLSMHIYLMLSIHWDINMID